jgi:hypothetical protein
MQLESAGVPGAKSPAGAIGLMQVMPQTHAALTARHQLGDDPYEPAANVTVGAACLREMLDRLGAPDAFAAYNAGPGRMLDHLLRRRSLPAKTQRYLNHILRILPGMTDARDSPPEPRGDAPTLEQRQARDDSAPAARLSVLRTPRATTTRLDHLWDDQSGALFLPLPSNASASPAHANCIAGVPP